MSSQTISQAPSLTDGQLFRSTFFLVREIASGTEGIVSRWENRQTSQVVAVKTPRYGRSADLQKESAVLNKVPLHEHIVSVLTHIQHWEPIGPALVFELADWGDVHTYRQTLETNHGVVPEMTLWKFLRDMSLALDWLHNCIGEPQIHGDLKPENILVFSPPGCDSSGIPLLPLFKICDISRLLPLSHSGPFRGTYEFGPPHAERGVRQTPAVDVYSIGASVQWFALGVLPVMSSPEFIKMRKEEGEYVPSLADLRTEAWRSQIPPAYRPLDASVEFQKDVMKLARPVPPYSRGLNSWYDRLVEIRPEKRISSRSLAKRFVPFADIHIEMMVRRRRYEAARQRYDEVNAHHQAKPRGRL